MRIIYTDQSFESLEESIQFLLQVQKVPLEKVLEIRNQLLDKADTLADNPYLGQYEEYLEHLEKGHRRLVDGNFKIIYRIEGDNVYVIDYFDVRQDPEKMKS
ncbi:MAG: type II toxin-antitoxin system RelE/ParE family toxin [Candidatus Cyclobacteriaceae bacterium M2_1C_046]